MASADAPLSSAKPTSTTAIKATSIRKQIELISNTLARLSFSKKEKRVWTEIKDRASRKCVAICNFKLQQVRKDIKELIAVVNILVKSKTN